MKLKVNVSTKDLGMGIKQKLAYMVNFRGLRTQINQIYAETIDPWVPYLTGDLSRSGLTHVDSRGVHYTVDYAEKVYYSDWEHYPLIHPLASSRWDVVAMETQRDVFIAKVKELWKQDKRKR